MSAVGKVIAEVLADEDLPSCTCSICISEVVQIIEARLGVQERVLYGAEAGSTILPMVGAFRPKAAEYYGLKATHQRTVSTVELASEWVEIREEEEG